MATAPSQTPEEHDDRSAQAAQGKQDGGTVGQSSGRPSYGVGGSELNLDADAGKPGGSGSASSAASPAPEPTE